MSKFYQRLAMLVLLVSSISGAVIYFTVDINTLKHLDTFKPWSIFAALLALSLGLTLDGLRLMHLVRLSGVRITLGQAVQVVFGNYFLALLTPGAAGGAVAQLMFLRNAGVTTGKATVFVVVRTLLSILFLLICLPFIFYRDPGLMPWISEQTLVIGSIVLVTVIIATIWLFRTAIPKLLLIKIAKKLNYRRRHSAFSLYRDIRGAVFLLSAAPAGMLKVFLESAFSLLALNSVVLILFIGMGVETDWQQVMGRMLFLNILLYFAPTPGGSGIAEGGFILLFSEFLPSGTVGIAAVTWRIIAEYLPFMIGLFYTVKVFGCGFTKQLK